MINRVVLVGRLTKDPELRYTPSGAAVVRFTLAVNRTFSNANGQREADFIQCTAWRKTAENTANFLRKGSLAGVEGRIQTGSYEGQDGKRVYTTEVNCESVQFLEPKKDNGQQSNSYSGQQSNSYNSQPSQNNSYRGDDPFTGGDQIQVGDDDLPF